MLRENHIVDAGVQLMDNSVRKAKPLPPPPLHYFKNDNSPVSCISFVSHNDNQFLAQGNQDGGLNVWDLESCALRWSVAAHESACRAVLQLADGRLLSQHREGALRLWQLHRMEPLLTLPYQHHGYCRATMLGDLVACPSEPHHDIILLDLRTGCEAARLSAPPDLGSVMALRTVPGDDSAALVAVYEAGDTLLWERGQTRPAASLHLSSEHTPMCVDLASDGRGLVGTSGTAVYGFRVSEQRQLVADTQTELTCAGVASVRVRGDCRIAALGCWDHRIRVLSWRKRRLLAVLEHHSKTVECVEFAPAPVALWKANALLASGSSDGSVALWKIYDDVS